MRLEIFKIFVILSINLFKYLNIKLISMVNISLRVLNIMNLSKEQLIEPYINKKYSKLKIVTITIQSDFNRWVLIYFYIYIDKKIFI